jgi:hypothetical protein
MGGCQFANKGEGSRPSSFPRATSSTGNAFPSDCPMNTPGEPKVPPTASSSASALDHLKQLVFEIRRDMADMKFNMEMMNQRISWLVALHANEALKRPDSGI